MSYQDLLTELAAHDPRIVVLTAENRAVIRALPERLGSRFIDVGICEQTLIGVAAGLALRGRVPICHALAAFLTMRAFEFIRTDIGIAGLPVILVGGVPGFLSEANGPTHQAIEDIALMRAIPGMQVVCPSDEAELLAAIPAVIATGKPTYVRYYSGATQVAHTTPYGLGVSERVREGRDVALITHGFLLREVTAAADLLASQGTSARVIDMRSVEPLDASAVLAAVRECGRTFAIEDHFQRGGLWSAACELLANRGEPGRVEPIALDNRWFRPGLLTDVLELEGFSAARLAGRIAAAMGGP
jgi:transketolase